MSQMSLESQAGNQSTGKSAPGEPARVQSFNTAAQRGFQAPKAPFFKRINPRMLLLAALALVIIGGPFAAWLRQKISGGVFNHGNYFEVNLKAMSSFDMDQANGKPTDIPERFRDLEGKRVELVGQMWAPKSASDDTLTYFQLVYSRTKCCFSGPPLAQHFVDANVLPAAKAYYYDDMVQVWGTLHVKFRQEAGVIKSVYEVDVDKVVSQD